MTAREMILARIAEIRVRTHDYNSGAFAHLKKEWKVVERYKDANGVQQLRYNDFGQLTDEHLVKFFEDLVRCFYKGWA